MIKVKHFAEGIEKDDGQRLWIEPISVTRDLREWCSIDHVLTHLGPPLKLWKWFERHPDAYDVFRAGYHENLSAGPYKDALTALAAAGLRENFTLIHQGDDSAHNTATALYEFITELQAYCPRE
ncbi:MAG: DUF488 family protein, N3 subclade [Tepidisphaeraceae bacterium]